MKFLAEMVAKDKGVLQSTPKNKAGKVSDGWFRRFMQRQKTITLRKGDPTVQVRMEACSQEIIMQYFDQLKEVLEEHDLMDCPGQLYNVDETGMPFDHCAPNVVAKKGQKKVRYRTSGNKSQVTVIGCVSAAGHAIPPFVIFDSKTLNHEWTEGELSGTTYGLSDKGWVDSEQFPGWLIDYFAKCAVGARLLLLLLDGHSSHYTPDMICYAKEHGIIIFCLPPHTTHAVFGPLKRNWQEACHKYMQKNVVTKYNFSSLLSEAWSKTMKPSTLAAGFRKCGVCIS